ncbi:MAG: glycosidase [Bacteroidota bacterium]|nr:glycosidase [Bacteroidota bacterium]
MKNYSFDSIILAPNDIDLSYSPLKEQLDDETYVLGAFNPGMTRLPDGNLLLMVRVAEALRNPVNDGIISAIRWDINSGYVLDQYKLDQVDISDPRTFILKEFRLNSVLALTSMSWLLPVELSGDGDKIINIHYDKIIAPQQGYQEYGIEDPRISYIRGKYYMTSCSVSSERQSTTLYASDDGINYRLEGIILDHQNKDMVLFEGTIENKFFALTRPLGSLYFATPPDSIFNPGPSINLAQSPDLLHWKPLDEPFIRPQKGSGQLLKLGGGAPPILTKEGWLVLFHGVGKRGEIGIYRTYWAILDEKNPQKILHLEMKEPVLEANPYLTNELRDSIYIEDVVFTTGIVEMEDHFIIASGELDLCTRITHIPKSDFRLNHK